MLGVLVLLNKPVPHWRTVLKSISVFWMNHQRFYREDGGNGRRMTQMGSLCWSGRRPTQAIEEVVLANLLEIL